MGRKGTFFQLINQTTSPCRVLYIVSPAYLFEMEKDGRVRYDDAMIIDRHWDDLESLGWNPPEIAKSGITEEAREAAAKRLAERKLRMGDV